MSVGKDSILRAANADAKKTEVKAETKPAEEVKEAVKAIEINIYNISWLYRFNTLFILLQANCHTNYQTKQSCLLLDICHSLT